MPPRNERIAAMVRTELGRDASITNETLLKKAKAIDPKVGRLSPRQFHATYRLPVVRASRSTSPAPKGPASAATKSAAAPPAAKSAASPAAQSTASSAPTTADTQSVAPTPEPATSSTTPPAPTSASAPAPTPTPPGAHGSTSQRSTSTAVGRPHAAEREAVRQILQLIAREALSTEDRGSFVRLLDSLDERAAVILGIFGRH